MARLRRAALIVLAVAAAGVVLAACGGTNGDAIAACGRVDRGLAVYRASLHAASAAVARRDTTEAIDDLAAAEQDAALANSADGTYNALMTLLQQAQQVPLKYLVASLTRTCDEIQSPNSYYGDAAPLSRRGPP